MTVIRCCDWTKSKSIILVLFLIGYYFTHIKTTETKQRRHLRDLFGAHCGNSQKRPLNFSQQLNCVFGVSTTVTLILIELVLGNNYGGQVKERVGDSHAEANRSLRRWMYQRGPEL